MKRLTISDIAALAGVGKATVSRVLNNTGYVRTATKEKVERIIRENTYAPSATARNLSKRESDVIGVIIPEADNPFFSELLSGISRIVDVHNLTMMFCNTMNVMEKDVKSLQTICRQHVRGLIYTPAAAYESTKMSRTISELLDKVRAPVVLVDRPLRVSHYDGVYTDNFAGAYTATQALIAAGHKKIGIVAGDLGLSIGRERLRGFQQALTDYRLPFDEGSVIRGEFKTHAAYLQSKAALKAKKLPTAYFAANNMNAIGFLKAAFEKRFRIPGDLGFISFDPIAYINDLGFNISHLDRDVAEMGAEATRMLLEKISGERLNHGSVIFPSRLRLLGSEALG